MATTAQRLSALEAAQVAQKAWNVAVNGRLAKLEGAVVVPPPVPAPRLLSVIPGPGSVKIGWVFP